MEYFAPKQHSAPKHWDPDHYLKFADQRMRPALDLLARVPLSGAARITDLGCGPGNVTPHLSRRFPGAELQGVDSSAEMLSTAHATHGDLARWVRGDANDWCPDAAQDLIYSNAALQWVDDHATLFPRLMGLVVPGGVRGTLGVPGGLVIGVAPCPCTGVLAASAAGGVGGCAVRTAGR